MFGEIYAPLPDAGRYLDRLGFGGTPIPDVQTLSALVSAHRAHVPFENLDVYDAEAAISLGTEALFDKIVDRRRGGYCFELNALFTGLLTSLGYDVYPVCARVVWMSGPDEYRPISHRAGIVTIDGTRYFVDVGFGGPSPDGALKLDDPSPQRSGADTFAAIKDPDGDFVICRVKDGENERLLKFSDRRCDNVDFLAPNEFQSRNPASGFRKVRMVNLTTPDGSVSLTGNQLTIRKGGEVTETVLENPEQLRRALRTHFGIAVEFPLKP